MEGAEISSELLRLKFNIIYVKTQLDPHADWCALRIDDCVDCDDCVYSDDCD